MKKIKPILAMIFLVGITSGCMMSYRNYENIKGTISKGRYSSPNKAFSCQVPKLIVTGARIEDNVSGDGKACDVYFQDDLGTWVNIVCIPVAPEKLGTARVQENFFEKFIVGRNTIVLHKEILSDENGNMTYAIVKVPKGSNMVEARKGRYDLIEGVLVFYRKNHVYRLSTQDSRSILSTEPVVSKAREKYLKSELIDFYRKMKFK
jgi:hypothetical protein